MGIKLDTANLIVEKARLKKDGCYRFRGVAYLVRNGNVTHFASNGTVYEKYGGFITTIGNYEYSIHSDEAGQRELGKI